MNILKVYIISADKVNLSWQKKTESNLFELTEKLRNNQKLKFLICSLLFAGSCCKVIFLPNILGINAGYRLH